MTKPGDSQTKKTIHELAKEFPEKTYIELEKYRDADRREEAQRIFIKEENQELKEDQTKEIWTEVWKARYEKEYKLRQEAIELFNACHLKATQSQDELDRIKKENNDLYKRIAKLKEAELAAHTLQKTRESGL